MEIKDGAAGQPEGDVEAAKDAQEAPAAGEEKAGDAGQDGGAQGGEDAQEARKVEDLPEWAQRELKSTRDEAARYRTQLREAQESVKGLKTVEEFEAAMQAQAEKAAEIEAELGRVRARQKVRDEFPGLSAEAFEFIPDGSEEEMRASAEKLAALTAGGGAKGLPRKGGGVTPADGVEAPFNAAEFVRSIPRM